MGALAGRGCDFGAAWKNDLSVQPGVGRQDKRHAATTDSADDAGQPAVVVGISVGEHDGGQSLDRALEDVDVVHRGVFGEAGVVKDGFGTGVEFDRDEQRVPMLGEELVLVPLQGRRRQRGDGRWS